MDLTNELILGKININPLIKARTRFVQILESSQNETDEIACIKLFEICYELSWKILKRVLEVKGLIDVNNPRDVFREAAVQGLIDDPELWFTFQEDRSKTVHTYNQDIATDIFSSLDEFGMELDKLIRTLKSLQ